MKPISCLAVSAATLALSAPVLHAATPENALVMAWNIDSISTFDPARVGEAVTTELLLNTCDPLGDFTPGDAAAKLTQYPSRRASYQDEACNATVTEAALEHDPAKHAAIHARLRKDWTQKGEMAVMFQTYNDMVGK